mmetsp:Transcript_42028/g.126939  ORF Transcript_42028/g.126939 Transcript_42028/m.126939 type:complete len:311 (+) Transcript_42028:1311-2243(+)
MDALVLRPHSLLADGLDLWPRRAQRPLRALAVGRRRLRPPRRPGRAGRDAPWRAAGRLRTRRRRGDAFGHGEDHDLAGRDPDGDHRRCRIRRADLHRRHGGQVGRRRVQRGHLRPSHPLAARAVARAPAREAPARAARGGLHGRAGGVRAADIARAGLDGHGGVLPPPRVPRGPVQLGPLRRHGGEEHTHARAAVGGQVRGLLGLRRGEWEGQGCGVVQQHDPAWIPAVPAAGQRQGSRGRGAGGPGDRLGPVREQGQLHRRGGRRGQQVLRAVPHAGPAARARAGPRPHRPRHNHAEGPPCRGRARRAR